MLQISGLMVNLGKVAGRLGYLYDDLYTLVCDTQKCTLTLTGKLLTLIQL